jgi:twitching motility protein PilT
VSAAFRRIPHEIPNHTALGLPSIVGEFTKKSYGMILVTGPTGSGKTTTLASLIDKVNQEAYGHIVTVEDPIEYIHQPKNCIINQRELGPDTWSYQTAVKSLLRQDPDFCLIGELRDLETVEAAIKIAETGHLVFATLHTNTAAQTLSRISNLYPGDQQERVRHSLSMIVQGILSQRLLPGLDGKLQLATEVLVANPAIRNLIREGKFQQITSSMQSGQDSTGMILMNQSLMGLLLNRKIDLKTAYEVSPDPE